MTTNQTQDIPSATKLPKVATRHSIKVEVKVGETYYWCACGLSKKQPFCDMSHVGTEFNPQIYKAEKDGLVGFCGCKYSAKGPVCDGKHKTLTEFDGC